MATEVIVASQVTTVNNTLRFIFTDFKPNHNKVVIPFEEASNLIQTGKLRPIRIHLKKDTYSNTPKLGEHSDTVAVGTITELYLNEEKSAIYAHAQLWGDEFPEVESYIRENTDRIRFSWEVYYEDSSIDDDGIKRLKGCVTKAATIVKTPAYGDRTKLVSFASEEKDDMDELLRKYEVASLEDLQNLIDSLVSFRRDVELERAQIEEDNARKEMLTHLPVEVATRLLGKTRLLDRKTFTTLVEALEEVTPLLEREEPETEPTDTEPTDDETTDTQTDEKADEEKADEPATPVVEEEDEVEVVPVKPKTRAKAQSSYAPSAGITKVEKLEEQDFGALLASV